MRGAIWWVAAACAAVGPAFANVCAWHRGHWPVPAADWWAGVVLPGCFKTWSIVSVVLLAGWAASAGPARPRKGTTALWGLWVGAQGLALTVFVSIPAWVWLARLNPGASLDLILPASLTVVPALGAATLSGATGVLLGAVGATVLGLVGGGGLVWVTWGGLT